MMWLKAVGLIVLVVCSVVWLWLVIGNDDDLPFKG